MTHGSVAVKLLSSKSEACSPGSRQPPTPGSHRSKGFDHQRIKLGISARSRLWPSPLGHPRGLTGHPSTAREHVGTYELPTAEAMMQIRRG